MQGVPIVLGAILAIWIAYYIRVAVTELRAIRKNLEKLNYYFEAPGAASRAVNRLAARAPCHANGFRGGGAGEYRMTMFDLIFMGGGVVAGLLLIALLGVEEKRRPRFYEWIGGGICGLVIGTIAAAIAARLLFQW